MKTSREKVLEVFEHRSAGDGVMWTGDPTPEVVADGAARWGIENDREAFFRHMDDDCRWIWADTGYCHPEGRPMFDTAYNSKARTTLSAAGCFADCESIAEVEAYPWPDVKYCDFTKVYEHIEKFSDKMVFTGMWSCFFHHACDFFGSAESSHRYFLGKTAFVLSGKIAVHFGFDCTGSNAVNLHIAWRKLSCKGLCQTDNRRLCCGINGFARSAVNSPH